MTRDPVRSVANGLTRMIILWILSKSPTSGYSIMKEVQKITGLNYHAGVLYPMLYNLEGDGLISSSWHMKGHMNVKRYMITNEGSATLRILKQFMASSIREIFGDGIAK